MQRYGGHNLVIETCTYYGLLYYLYSVGAETILNTEQGMRIIFGVRCIYMLRALNIKRLDFIGFMEL